MAKRVAAAPPEVDSESDDSEGESTKRLYDKSNKTMIAEWKGDVARLLELPWAKNMLKRLRKYDKYYSFWRQQVPWTVLAINAWNWIRLPPLWWITLSSITKPAPWGKGVYFRSERVMLSKRKKITEPPGRVN